MSNDSAHPSAPAAAASTHRICYLSRREGWIDPDNPRRPTSEVNLLAVALRSRVWTFGTAWESIFHSAAPRPIAAAFAKAMTRVPVSDREVELLAGVARQLGIELEVRD